MQIFLSYCTKINILQKLVYSAGAIICFCVYLIAQAAFTFPKSQLTTGRIIISILIACLCLIIIWGSYRYMLSKQNQWNFSPIFKTDGKSLLYALGGFILIITVQLLIVSIGGTNTSSNQETLSKLMIKTSPMFYVMLSIIAPICEELIFRGIFFEIFFTNPSKRNLILGALINGLLFGLAHDLHFDIFFIDYWFTGAIFSLLYLKTKNISTSIFAHMANNLLALLI